MMKGVDGWSTEMDSSWIALVIELFKLICKGVKYEMGSNQLLFCDFLLVYYSNGENEPAVILPILKGKYAKE